MVQVDDRSSKNQWLRKACKWEKRDRCNCHQQFMAIWWECTI